jgi:hypothetical protein
VSIGEPGELCRGVLTAAVGVEDDGLGQLAAHGDRH